MTDSPRALAESIRAFGQAAIRLSSAAAHGQEVQYLKPAAPSKRGETPEKAKGGISRPTEDIAMDERRLRLRASVISADLVMEELTEKANAAADELVSALDDWAGVRA